MSKPEELYLLETLIVKLTAQEKIELHRVAQRLNITVSVFVRALVARGVQAFSSGSLQGFALEQEGMDTLLKAISPILRKPKR